MRNVVVYVEQTAKYRIAKYRIANQGQLLDACMGSTHSSEWNDNSAYTYVGSNRLAITIPEMLQFLVYVHTHVIFMFPRIRNLAKFRNQYKNKH